MEGDHARLYTYECGPPHRLVFFLNVRGCDLYILVCGADGSCGFVPTGPVRRLLEDVV